MQLLDEHGRELSTIRLKMLPATTGPSGEGMCAVGAEEHGALAIELRLNFATQQGHLTLRLKDLTGLRPAEVLPGLRTAGAFGPPNKFRFAAPYGPASHPAISIPVPAYVDFGGTLEVVEALAVIQDHTTEQITIPDLTQLSSNAGRELLHTAQLLQAGSLAATWSNLTETVPAGAIDPHADLSTPSPAVYVKPLIATIGEQQVPLGYRRAALASARVESITHSADGQQLQLKLVPGDDNSALIEYILAPE
jgi:hypothetical protein